MASFKTRSPRLFARDVIAFSDAELDQYLVEHNRVVNVKDPENITDDFIERLREIANRASAEALPQHIDLDQVNARLQEHIDKTASESSSLEDDSEGQYRADLQSQAVFYKWLVDDGGRPSHPLSRLEDIVKDPGEYGEILEYWQGEFPDKSEWKVFGLQFDRWAQFRFLQRFARGFRGYDYFRALWEFDFKMMDTYLPWMKGKQPGQTEEEWEHDWEQDQKYYLDYVKLGFHYLPWRSFTNQKGRGVGQQDFPEYVEALKERLASHGFTRPFELNADVAQQDKMATWIEYLGYEYYWSDYHKRRLRGTQKRYNNAWKELVGLSVLRPGDTEEFVLRSKDYKNEILSEREDATEEVEKAKIIVSVAETNLAQCQQSKLPLQTLQQRLVAARSRLEAAQAKYDSCKKLTDAIFSFYGQTTWYRSYLGDIRHHDVLLRWVLQQVPLIEAELNPPNEHGADQRNGTNVLKRNRNPSEEPNENSPAQSRGEDVSSPNPKRQRRTASLSNDAVSEREREARKTNLPAPSDQPGASKPPRRSARIAEIAEKSAAAAAAAALAQASTPPPSTRPTKRRKGKQGRAQTKTTLSSKPSAVSKRGRKPRKPNPQATSDQPRAATSNPPAKREGKPKKPTPQASPDEPGPSSKPVRRSARIAAKSKGNK